MTVIQVMPLQASDVDNPFIFSSGAPGAVSPSYEAEQGLSYQTNFDSTFAKEGKLQCIDGATKGNAADSYKNFCLDVLNISGTIDIQMPAIYLPFSQATCSFTIPFDQMLDFSDGIDSNDSQGSSESGEIRSNEMAISCRFLCRRFFQVAIEYSATTSVFFNGEIFESFSCYIQAHYLLVVDSNGDLRGAANNYAIDLGATLKEQTHDMAIDGRTLTIDSAFSGEHSAALSITTTPRDDW